MPPSLRLRFTLIAVGLWLASTPFILFDQAGASEPTTLAQKLTFIMMGLFAVVLGSIGTHEHIPWRATISVVFIIVLNAAPNWFDPFPGSVAILNSVIVGIVVMFSALFDLMNRQSPDQFR